MFVKHVQRVFQDERGWIMDILENEPIESVTIIHSAKGSVRGNHYHRETSQWVYVLRGTLRYIVQAPDGKLQEGLVREGDVLLTEPMEKHAMEAVRDATILVLTRGPRGGRNYEADTFRLSQPLI